MTYAIVIPERELSYNFLSLGRAGDPSMQAEGLFRKGGLKKLYDSSPNASVIIKKVLTYARSGESGFCP
ncbi:MAG: hypothetical protein G01um101466_118 [Parcubacteria group bacterium Gr01-1014_66]|nr:MAG: hypothetical protein G01um101466_118 [Parcubacteria group bacterium Gr01-1014_66]